MTQHLTIEQMRDIAVAALEDIKGEDILVLDTTKLTAMFECMIVASGNSNRQVKALANSAREKLKEAGAEILGMEGDVTGEWVLVDAGPLIIHVMLPAVRDYYNIEQLWGGQKPTFNPTRPWEAAIQAHDDPAGKGMKLYIIAVGHKMPDWVEIGFKEYVKRMPREAQVELIELKPGQRAGSSVEKAMDTERERILAALPSGCRKIVLDERGANWTTMKLADKLKGWQREGGDVAFVIGGADGLHADIKRQADELLQLSALTMPHGMVRVLLAEQLYRAVAINQGHPYHRE